MLENPDIIYIQLLWKNGSVIWVARPVAPHCNVYNKEEGAVKGIGNTYLRAVNGIKGLIIHIPLNGTFLPENGEDMVFIPKGFRSIQ